MSRRAVGASIEDWVAGWLEARGYRIIRRNLHLRRSEFDLIAHDGNELVFVEVKARTGSRFGSAVEALDRRKQSRLLRAARVYLGTSLDQAHRFDLIAVQIDSLSREPRSVDHLKNVIEA